MNLDSVESVSLGSLVERLGRLSDERMRQICEALEIAWPAKAERTELGVANRVQVVAEPFPVPTP